MDDTRTPAAAHTAVEFMPLRLRLQPGDHIIDLTGPDVLLGRQSDADLRMPQPDVSRQHCRFQFTGTDWQVLDLDSLNGVYVNGARVRRVTVIRPGDQIRICGVEFGVEAAAEPAENGDRPDVLRSIAGAIPQPTVHRQAS